MAGSRCRETGIVPAYRVDGGPAGHRVGFAFGTLIALPLQRRTRDQGDSVFLGDKLSPWPRTSGSASGKSWTPFFGSSATRNEPVQADLADLLNDLRCQCSVTGDQRRLPYRVGDLAVRCRRALKCQACRSRKGRLD